MRSSYDCIGERIFSCTRNLVTIYMNSAYSSDGNSWKILEKSLGISLNIASYLTYSSILTSVLYDKSDATDSSSDTISSSSDVNANLSSSDAAKSSSNIKDSFVDSMSDTT